jgi:hypothetical protein
MNKYLTQGEHDFHLIRNQNTQSPMDSPVSQNKSKFNLEQMANKIEKHHCFFARLHIKVFRKTSGFLILFRGQKETK